MSFGHLNHGKSPLEVEIVTGPGSDVVEFEAGAAITAGNVVRFDTTATGDARARTVVTGAVDGLCIGVALEDAAAAGDIVRVCIAGYIEGVNATGGAGIVAGDTLAAGAAGIVDTYAAAATDPPVGVALANEAANAVTMYWFRKL
jgi:hypothetical protein